MIYYLKVNVQGTAAMIMDRLTEGSLSLNPTSKEVKRVKEITIEEIVRQKLYISEETGQLYAPTIWFLHAIDKAGGKRTVKLEQASRKRQISTQKTSLIHSCVYIKNRNNRAYLFARDENGDRMPVKTWAMYAEPANLARNAGKAVTWKPLIEKWETDLFVIFDDEYFELNVFQQLLMSAGQREGVGNRRVNAKGQFGTFCVRYIKQLTLDEFCQLTDYRQPEIDFRLETGLDEEDEFYLGNKRA